MSTTLRRRLHLLEVAHEQRELAQSTRSPARRWALLNLAVRTAAGENTAPWRAALEALSAVPATDRRELTTTERTMRVLALLCREARASAPYRDLLAVIAVRRFAQNARADLAAGGRPGRPSAPAPAP